MLSYARLLVRMLEGIDVSVDELLIMLRRAMRQRSILRGKRRDYVLDILHQHPPWDLSR